MVAFKIPGKTAPVKAAPARSPRRRVLIEGSFQTLSATYQVAVRNLSCTGALLESEADIREGTQGVLATRHLDCFCRVIWRRGNLYGIGFEHPLQQHVVLNIHRITQVEIEQEKVADAKAWWGAAR